MNNDRYIFRGKRLDDGELIYGNHVSGIFFDGVNKETVHYIMTGDFIDYDCFEDFSENYGYYEVDPETTGQCTGLKDKRGTLIFEGDIIRNDRDEQHILTGVVKWSELNLAWLVSMQSEYTMLLCDFTTDTEVIGNIWDNPELIPKNFI